VKETAEPLEQVLEQVLELEQAVLEPHQQHSLSWH
jgi:hypothetical protein